MSTDVQYADSVEILQLSLIIISTILSYRKFIQLKILVLRSMNS